MKKPDAKICKTLLIIIVFAFISGCARVQSVRYETIQRPSKPVAYPIEIFDAKDIKRPYKVIGLVRVEVRKRHDIEDTIEHLKIEARKMGGDALVDLKQQPIGAGIPYQGGTVYSGHVRDLWTAKVIVWEQK